MNKNNYRGKIPVTLVGIAIALNILNIYLYKRIITNGLLSIEVSVLDTVLSILGNRQTLESAYLIKLLYESLILIEIGLFIILLIQEWLNTSKFSKFVVAYIIMDLTALQVGLTYRVNSLYLGFVNSFSDIRLGGAQAFLPTLSHSTTIILLLAPLSFLMVAYAFYGYEWVVSAEDIEKEEESDYEIYIYAVIIIGLIMFIPFSQVIIQFPNVNYPGYTLRNTGDAIIISRQILGANLTQLNVCSDNLYGINLTSLQEYYIIRPSQEAIENAQLYGKPLIINVTITGKLIYNDNYAGTFIYKTRLKVPTPKPVFNVSFNNNTLILKTENYPCHGVKKIEITPYLDSETPLNKTVYYIACPYLFYRTDAPIVALNISYQYLGDLLSFSFYIEEGSNKTIEVQP